MTAQVLTKREMHAMALAELERRKALFLEHVHAQPLDRRLLNAFMELLGVIEWKRRWRSA